ncbi:MAG: DUF2066 domain-containing protein [Gammaproteobacteria bacterium]|nr:DUF2066 domain-containing protein [Gammaproteobacteria bacterium]
MKHKLICMLVLLIGMSTLQPLQAVVVEELYSIELPVADQTTSLRLGAFGEAFKLVVIKVSGSDDALRSPAFKRPMQSSARYVKQFRYINRKDEDAEGFDSGQLFLKIDFNQQLIEGLLRENDFPIWGRERPGSLLIISYDVNETIQLVSGDTTPEMVALIDEAAVKLGLPVLFPLMDLEDIMLINIADIVSRQYEAIEIMADRYAPDALVIGQIIGRSGEGWNGDWEVRFEDQIFKWEYKDSSRQNVVDQGIKHLARVLALEYALEDHRRVEESLYLSVSSLTEFKNLISVQKYLESMSVVDSVRVSLVSAHEVTFIIKLRNSSEDFQRLIELGEVLEQLELPQINTRDDSRVILNYAYINREASN